MDSYSILLLLSLAGWAFSSSGLGGTGYMSDHPDPRCNSIGRMLVDKEDPCSYLVCDYGRVPQLDSSGKHKLFVRRMPCAPGTSVPRDYERTARLLGNPCTSKGLVCKRTRKSKSRYRAPHGKKFKDESGPRVPNAIIKMEVTGKNNWAEDPKTVHGLMNNVWREITERMKELDHRRSLRKYPLTPPDFTNRMTDLQALWAQMESGVEAILKDKASGRKRTAGDITKKMRELQQLWLKMWRKISELHTLEIKSIQREPLPEVDATSVEASDQKSSVQKYRIPEIYYRDNSVDYKNNVPERPQGAYRADPVYSSHKENLPYSNEREDYKSNYEQGYGGNSGGRDEYTLTREALQQARKEALQQVSPVAETYNAQQDTYPPLSQEYLDPSQRISTEDLSYQNQRSKRLSIIPRGVSYRENTPYEHRVKQQDRYGNVQEYDDTYQTGGYSTNQIADSAGEEVNGETNYRGYNEQEKYAPSYHGQPNNGYHGNHVEQEHENDAYGQKEKQEERPTVPLETIDENGDIDIMVPSGFGSEMPLKSLWMEMKGVLGYMMENGKLEAANIPDEEEGGEYDGANNRYYEIDNTAPQQPRYRQDHNDVYRAPKNPSNNPPSPPRRYRYPQGRELHVPKDLTPVGVDNHVNMHPPPPPPSPQALQHENNRPLDSHSQRRQPIVPHTNSNNINNNNNNNNNNNEVRPEQEKQMPHGQQVAAAVSELNQAPLDESHPAVKLREFDINDFDKAYQKSIQQWRDIREKNKGQ